MKEIYFDNATSNFPKAKAAESENVIVKTKENLAKLFCCEDFKNIVFTENKEKALELVYSCLFKKGDHIVATQMDSDDVLNKLNHLKKEGIIELSLANCDSEGYVCLFTLEKLIKDNTKAVVIPHASNVCGTIFPVREIGEICKKHSVLLIVDASQTAGIVPIDMKEMGIDVLVFEGNKGLRSSKEIGGLAFNNDSYEKLFPLISKSINENQDTLTISEISGSIDNIEKTGIQNINKKTNALKKLFIDNVKTIPNIKIVGYNQFVSSISIVSLSLNGKDIAKLAEFLEKNSIKVSFGLQGAESAHKALGTYPKGTIRFSFNQFNAEDEVLFACSKIKEFMTL